MRARVAVDVNLRTTVSHLPRARLLPFGRAGPPARPRGASPSRVATSRGLQPQRFSAQIRRGRPQSGCRGPGNLAWPVDARGGTPLRALRRTLRSRPLPVPAASLRISPRRPLAPAAALLCGERHLGRGARPNRDDAIQPFRDLSLPPTVAPSAFRLDARQPFALR